MCSATADAITVQGLRRHVQTLAGDIGERTVLRPQALSAAAHYIEATWAQQGYDVVSQSYLAKGVPCRNLEATRMGAGQPEEILLLGAHYDSITGGPGANDNGSGVAALLELSRRFMGRSPRRTVRFVAFVNEEPPFFYWGQMGSMVYARAARERGDDIRIMLSLETIGYYSDRPGSQAYPPLFRYFHPDRGNFVAFVSNLRSRRALHQMVSAFRAHCDFPCEHTATFGFVPGVSWSDHLAFWRQGYRALMVTDTAFYRYAHYHSATDTPDRLTYPAFATVVTGLDDAIAELALRERL